MADDLLDTFFSFFIHARCTWLYPLCNCKAARQHLPRTLDCKSQDPHVIAFQTRHLPRTWIANHKILTDIEECCTIFLAGQLYGSFKEYWLGWLVIS